MLFACAAPSRSAALPAPVPEAAPRAQPPLAKGERAVLLRLMSEGGAELRGWCASSVVRGSVVPAASRGLPGGVAFSAAAVGALRRWCVFNRVADSSMWSSAASGTISGLGSLVSTTSAVRRCLDQWIAKYDIRSVLDVPCGDANWQGLIPALRRVEYIGGDIALASLRRARERPRNSNFSFVFTDVVSFPVLRAYDLVIFRDVLGHLPYDEAMTALRNFKNSGSKYIMLGYATDRDDNVLNNTEGRVDQSGVRYGFEDVRTQPFNFAEALETCPCYPNARMNIKKRSGAPAQTCVNGLFALADALHPAPVVSARRAARGASAAALG